MARANTSLLHSTILKFIIEHGYGPSVAELAEMLQMPQSKVFVALHALQSQHGVVLYPNAAKIWVIHPFSLAPTLFLVSDGQHEWWGSCAWCALGAAALLDRDVTITTILGGNGPQVDIHIQNGQVVERDYWVHFPVPMRQAWDNVIYTCSMMLLFDDHAEIDRWCAAHRINKGDVQPISTVWAFSQVWYGRHLDPDWHKWTTREANEIFEKFGLTDNIWQMPDSDTRF